jgi:IS5 family transposase
MIPPRIKPSAFWWRQPSVDLFVQDQRQSKLGSFIANLAAMDELIDFSVIAAQVDKTCPRADRSKGGRPRDARALWSVKQSLTKGALGGPAIFEAVSQQLQAHGHIPRGGQTVDASIVQAPITQARSQEREALNEPEGWSAKRLQHHRDARLQEVP